MTMAAGDWVVVGMDNGGNKNSATVLDSEGHFLVEQLIESPSRVTEGPDIAIESLATTYQDILARTGISADQRPRHRLRHAGAGERARHHLVERLHELFASRMEEF